MRLCGTLLFLFATNTAYAQTAAEAPEPAPPPPAAPPPYYPYPYPPGRYPVAVDIVGMEPNLAFTISDKDKRPIAECPGNCRLMLLPGRYQIFVHATDDTLAGSRMVDITTASTVRVDPDTTAHRDVGLGLGIAGPVIILASLAALLANADWYSENEDRSQADETEDSLAVLGLLGGLAITPIGWVMFGSSFKPEVEVDTGAPRAATFRPSATFGAVITF